MLAESLSAEEAALACADIEADDAHLGDGFAADPRGIEARRPGGSRACIRSRGARPVAARPSRRVFASRAVVAGVSSEDDDPVCDRIVDRDMRCAGGRPRPRESQLHPGRCSIERQRPGPPASPRAHRVARPESGIPATRHAPAASPPWPIHSTQHVRRPEWRAQRPLRASLTQDSTASEFRCPSRLLLLPGCAFGTSLRAVGSACILGAAGLDRPHPAPRPASPLYGKRGCDRKSGNEFSGPASRLLGTGTRALTPTRGMSIPESIISAGVPRCFALAGGETQSRR